MTVCCAGLDETGSAGLMWEYTPTSTPAHLIVTNLFRPGRGGSILPPQPSRTGLIQTCTPNGHLYRVTYARYCIDTINSPDDGLMAARNVWRIEINIHEKELFIRLVIYKDYP